MAGADPVLTRLRAALASWDEEALEALAGAGALRLGRRDAATVGRIEGDAAIVTVGAFEVTLRKSPAEARCSCPARRLCRHVMAAVLAVRGEDDAASASASEPAESEPPTAQSPPSSPVSAPSAVAPAVPAPSRRSSRRRAVSVDAESLLAPLSALLEGGLTRLSHDSVAHVRALAASARAAHRPRVEAALARLAGEIGRQLERDARASTAAILDEMAAALEAAEAADPGQWRGAYAAAGTLHLAGLGARAWASRGGWRGLTLYFWDERGHRCLSWTEARREDTRPLARYGAGGAWEGAPPLQDLCRRRLRLDDAWLDERGRLSSRGSTRCVAGEGSVPLETGVVVADFRDIARRALRHLGTSAEETALVVALKPARWDDAAFDRITQMGTRGVFDGRGQRLPLMLAYDPACPRATAALEGPAPDGVLGTVAVVEGCLCVVPWVLYRGAETVNLTLDTLGTGDAASAGASTPLAVEGGLPPSATPLGLLLSRVEAFLERRAEAGDPRGAGPSDLPSPRFDDGPSLAVGAKGAGPANLVSPLQALGLRTCAEALATAVDSPTALLRAWRVVRRAARLEAVAAAAERAGIDIWEDGS